MSDRELQTLRNEGNLSQQAVDEIVALREDAARYRFLRDVAWHDGALLPFLERYGPFEWDDAIDEAKGEK
jgi:hypothetical protein